jgi:hypothetical protein
MGIEKTQNQLRGTRQASAQWCVFSTMHAYSSNQPKPNFVRALDLAIAEEGTNGG